eukprot:c11978_g1_i2.p2 GENE.c11978_g1_i2~~c11978_g1_i2.p2  ORF type:complete len:101 (-),score=29.49 c11978_g1_i2:203-505(-)
MATKRKEVEEEEEEQEEDTHDSKRQRIQPTENGEYAFEMDPKRRVTVRKFKGKTYVDIREFYEDKDGSLKPGKKGISLTTDQWETLKDMVGDIDDAIQQI